MRLTLLLPLLAACQRAPKVDPATDAAASASSAGARVVASTTPSAAAAATRAWFEGSWQGAFQAELFRIELAVGGAKEWKQDDGKLASGPAKLQLQIAADGGATGNASGALGDPVVTGHAEGDRVALTLASASPDGFHGVILASQAPGGMLGVLSASSADSLQVRKANVTLSRATP